MKLYHVTSAKNALQIETQGFRDTRGRYMTDHEYCGVWLSDAPLDGDNMGTPIDDPVVFEIDADATAVAEFEWIEEGKPYREWLVPASVLNRVPRRRYGNSD